MAEPLKNIYSKQFIDELATALKIAYPAFDANKFTKLVFDKTWADRELKERMRHISQIMREVLPASLDDVYKVFEKAIHHLRKTRTGEMYFEFMFFPDYVEVYGIDDFRRSIKALEQITQFSSAEFAIRPFLLKYPDETQKQMMLWAKHEQAMVRRLATEGFRPRLPWAMAVPYLKKDPSVILPVLEILKNDPSETVRRSVANNLNDIAKDHPELVNKLVKSWTGHSEEVDKVIRHGSRTLLKRANADTLKYFGLAEVKGVTVSKLELSKKSIRIGETLQFSFVLKSPADVKLRIEYGIDYVKASGKTSRKIFKISEGPYGKGLHEIHRKQSFKDFTTRKHHPGVHGLAILVNGKEKAYIEFALKK